MGRIGILVNPQAGGIRRDPALPERMRALLEPQDELIVAERADEVPAALAHFRDTGLDVLGIVGGDGSNLYAITAATQIFNGTLPPIAMLKGGSVNTVGRTMGLKGTPENLLRSYVLHRANGGMKTLAAPTLRVNDKVGFVFGAGLVANFYDQFYQGKGKRIGDVVQLVARCFVAAVSDNDLSRRLFHPVRVRILVDGVEAPTRDCTLMLASTIDNLLGFRVTYRAKESHDRFHLVASENHHRRLARQFYRAFLGKPLTGERHFDDLAKTVELDFGAVPQKYMVDGDLFEAQRVTLSIGPTLKILAL